MNALEYARRQGIRPTRDLISWGYLELQRELHARPDGYGGKGKKWVDAVAMLLVELKALSVLDYGCGQGTLARELRALNIPGLRIAEYDPAILGKDSSPSFADLVTVTDVLEHIEPNRLDVVLEHLRILARKAVFAVISTRESNKVMADGRNAHLIVESGKWWVDRLQQAGFQVAEGPRRNGKVAREICLVLTPCSQ